VVAWIFVLPFLNIPRPFAVPLSMGDWVVTVARLAMVLPGDDASGARVARLVVRFR
jgi:hypothetical protein